MAFPITDLERNPIGGRPGSSEWIGRWTRQKLSLLVDLPTLLYLAFKEPIVERKKGFALVYEITLRQIFFTGVEALKVVVLIALALGTVVTVQAGNRLAFLGRGIDFIFPILIVAILRELGPLITALIVIGRSGTAIATELGNMIVAHEVEAIRVMGINPIYFIVTPRIIGVTIAVIGLAIVFNVVALTVGFFVSQWILPVSLAGYLEGIINAITPPDLVFGLLKSILFGLLIAVTCTYYGLSVRTSSIEVPQAATRGVVSAMLFCFATNALLTILFYL
jgi:phospholipid/cholesterol/gamma-HCH transport system permease protein